MRITRTPGRGLVNTVSLGDLIDPDSLSAAMVFSCWIDNKYLFKVHNHHRPFVCYSQPCFQYFPFKTGRQDVPVHIGRDMANDGDGRSQGHLETKHPTSRADFDRVVEGAQAWYKERCTSDSFVS